MWQMRQKRQMKRTLAATIACLLLGSVGVTAEQKGGPKKPKDAKHAVAHSDDTDSAKLMAQVSWSTHDVEIIRRHYTPKYRDLPPGLRKKYQRTGQLPPGWQKKMQPFPAALERDCAPLPRCPRCARRDLQLPRDDHRRHGPVLIRRRAPVRGT